MVTNLRQGDCGAQFDYTPGNADGILCSELEVGGASMRQYFDVAGTYNCYSPWSRT